MIIHQRIRIVADLPQPFCAKRIIDCLDDTFVHQGIFRPLAFLGLLVNGDPSVGLVFTEIRTG